MVPRHPRDPPEPSPGGARAVQVSCSRPEKVSGRTPASRIRPISLIVAETVVTQGSGPGGGGGGGGEIG
ncbi:hypothetical protein E2C01_084927 [Portunus trituberculatus]|uniref:Uncharacterized protein n=1 Tax=Portunus trituberculatus TaxID=210409 RepID=A0A5B7J192_PORTR|nr:hypothetical protein [Portunus trituberculatus]